MTPLPPRYEVLKTLGQGAMGKVLLARDKVLGREVAIKVLASGAGSELEDELVRRFAREARLMGLVEHPHLIRIHEFDATAVPPYLVMDRVEGVTLTEWLQAKGPMDVARMTRLVGELGGALDALHARGMLHRDLKPANVMLRSADGAAVLMDLGLATSAESTMLTRTGQILGTPRYLPPEVVLGKVWTGRGDLFQLGVVAFEALTGIHLIQARSLELLPTIISEGRWAPFPAHCDQVPAAVKEAILRMLSVDPAARFGSGAEFAAALAGARAAAPHRPTPQARKPGPVLTEVGFPEGGPPTPGPAPAARPPPRAAPAGPGAAPGPETLSPGRAAVLGFGMALIGAALWGLPGTAGSPPAPTPGSEDGPLEPVARLAAGGRLGVVATRSCRVRFGGGDGAAFDLEPGERFLEVPPGLAEPWTLAWEAEGTRGELVLDPAPILGRALDGLLDAGAEDPTPAYRDTRPPRPRPELRAPFAELAAWIPALLAAKALPPARRAALFRALERAQRSVAQERLLGLPPAPPDALDLRPLAPGSRRVDPDPRPEGTALAWLPVGGDGGANALGIELAVADFKDLRGGAYADAAAALRFVWPTLDPPPRTAVALAVQLHGLPKNLALELRAGAARARFPGVWFWGPDPRPEGRKFAGVLEAVLPADLAPEPGDELRLEVHPLLGDGEGKVRLTALRVRGL